MAHPSKLMASLTGLREVIEVHGLAINVLGWHEARLAIVPNVNVVHQGLNDMVVVLVVLGSTSHA
jgi:hypothetical protein